MIDKQWMRKGVGACGVAVVVLGAGLAFAPAAHAATPTSTLTGTGLVSGTVGAAGGIVNGAVTPTPGATSPVTVSGTGGTVSVGVNGTTATVGTGDGLGVGVTGTGGSAVGVVIGSTPTGTSVDGGTTTGTGGTPGTSGLPGTTGVTGAPGGSGTNGSGTNGSGTNGSGTNGSGTSGSGTSGSGPSSTGTAGGSTSQPIMLTALGVTPEYPTVYPAKDGYRDTEVFQLQGTTSDGLQHAASGVATLTFGSSTVKSWSITATDQAISWSGLKGGRLVPGHYVFTARIGDSTAAVSGSAGVDVSAQKLASATTVVTAKAVSGTHRMAAKPAAGLSRGKVTVRIISKVTGVHGKQYLVFAHGGKKVKVLIRNGKHTSKAVTIPRSFTTYTISHTWKKHTVKISSLKFKYVYKALK